MNAQMLENKDRFIRLKEVEELTGLKRATIYLYMKQGKFPQNVPLFGNSVGWLESEIKQWMQNKINQRNQKEL